MKINNNGYTIKNDVNNDIFGNNKITPTCAIKTITKL